MLSKLLRSDPEKTLADVLQQQQEAAAKVEAARAAYQDAIRDAADNPADLDKPRKARKALDEAERDLALLSEAVGNVQSRVDAKAAQAAKEARRREWATNVDTVAKRADAAGRMFAAIEEVARCYHEVRGYNNNLIRALPRSKYDHSGALLESGQLDGLAMRELARHQVGFAMLKALGLQTPHELEPVAPMFHSTVDLVKHWRAQALGADDE